MLWDFVLSGVVSLTGEGLWGALPLTSQSTRLPAGLTGLIGVAMPAGSPSVRLLDMCDVLFVEFSPWMLRDFSLFGVRPVAGPSV